MRLPEGWSEHRLHDVTLPATNWNPHKDDRNIIRYVDVSAVSREELKVATTMSHTMETAPSRARRIVKTGDTIFATVRPRLRRIAKIPAELNGEVVSTAFCILRPDQNKIDPDFLFYATQQTSFVDAVVSVETGASYPAVRNTDILNQVIALPSISEQKQISMILNAARSVLLTQSRAIEVTQELKHAAMRTLFTRGLHREAQKETEIGQVPENWESLSISDLGTIITGETPPTKDRTNYNDGDIPFIAPGDIEHGSAIYSTEKHITLTGLEKTRPIGENVICFVCIGSTIGKVGYTATTPCATNQQINSIIPRKDFHPLYIFYLMTYWADHIKRQASPSPVPILSKGVFEQITIFSSLDHREQQKIAAILDTIDRKINLHRRKRSVLSDLFKTLLCKLMTGKIHVTEICPSTCHNLT